MGPWSQQYAVKTGCSDPHPASFNIVVTEVSHSGDCKFCMLLHQAGDRCCECG